MENEYRSIKSHVESVKSDMENARSIVVFDTETTGLVFEYDKVIQFSAILYEINNGAFNEMNRMNIYIDPQRPLDEIITRITGITDEDLIGAETEDAVIRQIDDFMKTGDVWAGYNVGFDMGMLEAMHKRCGQPWIVKPTIDVLEMARNCIYKQSSGIKNHKLGTVTNYLFPDMQVNFHDSLEDVRATGKCMEYLLEKYRGMEFSTQPKEKIAATWASFWVNPHNQGQRRIKVFSGRKDIGIYWDCKNHCWSCKKDKASREAFAKLDIDSIERQVLYKYGKIYDADNMDDLSRNWGAAIREKEKAEKAKEIAPEIRSLPEFDMGDDVELW